METVSTVRDLENISARTNQQNYQDPAVLVSLPECDARCVCNKLQFFCFFCQWSFRSRSSKRERIMLRISARWRGIVEAVADPPRECAMDETTPMKLSSLHMSRIRAELTSDSDCNSHISWTMCILQASATGHDVVENPRPGDKAL